jgi:hypothetical protein
MQYTGVTSDGEGTSARILSPDQLLGLISMCTRVVLLRIEPVLVHDRIQGEASGS